MDPELPADLLSLEARAKRAAHAAGRFCADPRCDCTALDLRPEPEVQRTVSAELGVRAVACLESLLALTGTDGWNGSFALDDALEEARDVLLCVWTVVESLHTSPSPSTSDAPASASVAQVPASVKDEGAVMSGHKLKDMLGEEPLRCWVLETDRNSFSKRIESTVRELTRREPDSQCWMQTYRLDGGEASHKCVWWTLARGTEKAIQKAHENALPLARAWVAERLARQAKASEASPIKP